MLWLHMLEAAHVPHKVQSQRNNSNLCLCSIAIFGLAFLIATITQLQAAFTRNFHYDMKDDLPNWFMWVLVVTGTPVPSPSLRAGSQFHLILTTSLPYVCN